MKWGDLEMWLEKLPIVRAFYNQGNETTEETDCMFLDLSPEKLVMKNSQVDMMAAGHVHNKSD